LAYYDHHPLLLLSEPIALIGGPGAGVQVTGAVIASTLGLPIHDIRRKIEHRAGCALHAYVNRASPEKRQELEKSIISQALKEHPSGVITLDPDSLDNPETLDRVLKGSTLIYIERSLPNLRARLHTELCTSPERYPMLQGYENSDLQGLPEALATRQAIYGKAKVVMLARGAAPISLGRILADELLETSAPHSLSQP